MFKKLIVIGAFVISVVAMSSTHANAQFFDGWVWTGFSEVEGRVDIVGIPIPYQLSASGSGAIAVVTATLTSRTVEVVCEKNGKKRVVTQFPRLFKSVDTEQITEAPKGKATVNFRFVLPGGEPDGGGPDLLSIASATFEPTCGLFGGTVVPGSGALRTMSITMQSFLCSETPQACGGDDLRLSSQPTQPAPVDTVRLACGLLKINRDKDGIPIHGQEFTCFEFNGDDHDD